MSMVDELENFVQNIMAQNPGMTHDEALAVVVDLIAQEMKNPGWQDN
jgi:hypothetical protein